MTSARANRSARPTTGASANDTGEVGASRARRRPGTPTRSSVGRRTALGVAVAGLAAVVLPAADTPADPPFHVGPPLPQGRPWFGILQAEPVSYERFVRAGVRRITVELGWDAYQPTAGRTDLGYVSRTRARIAELHAAGVDVVLDPGLHYPPAWVFALPGQTRFVNQYGDVWRGRTGEAVANAVFNPAVRAAGAAYLDRIGRDLGANSFTAVRVGGLLTGELRYPDAHEFGRTDALWAYDPAAQAGAPVPGWRPGTGTAAQATASLRWYLDSLTGYERWLLGVTATAFPRAELHVLFPGWGLRPGEVQDAVADGLRGRTPAERGDSLAAGLDHAGQVAALAAFGRRGVVYTTWLDAADQGPSTAQQAPIRYLAALAAQHGLAAAGENTGATTAAALRTSVERVRDLQLAGMMWMSAAPLLAGDGLTVEDYRRAIAAG